MLYFDFMSINFNWNKVKKILMKERGVCFEDIVSAIHEDKVLDNTNTQTNRGILINLCILLG